jgi:hypothetical protein
MCGICGFLARDVAIRYASESSIQCAIEARLSTLDRDTCEAGMDIMRRPRPEDGGPEGFGPPPDFRPRQRPRPTRASPRRAAPCW